MTLADFDVSELIAHSVNNGCFSPLDIHSFASNNSLDPKVLSDILKDLGYSEISLDKLIKLGNRVSGMKLVGFNGNEILIDVSMLVPSEWITIDFELLRPKNDEIC